MNRAKLVVDCDNAHGEGVIWCEKRQEVLWTDIEGCLLWSYSPNTKQSRSFKMPNRLCAFMVREDASLLAAFDSYVAILRFASEIPEASSVSDEVIIEKLFDFEPENPHSRLNDGKADQLGNFVVGGVNETFDDVHHSSVIKIDTDLTVYTLIEAVTCANSLCFSPDGKTLYFADTPNHQILAYDYSPDMTSLGEPKVVFTGEGRYALPDGSTVDSEGYIWNAVWGGNAVIRIDPETGSIVRVIEVPATNTSCVAIGGEKLDTLYITSSKQGLSETELENEPQNGGLFSFSLS